MMVWTLEVVIFNFSEPMSRAHANRVLKKMGGMSMLVTFGALVFLAVWIATKLDLLVNAAAEVDVDLSEIVWEQLNALAHEPPLLLVAQIGVGIIFKLWLSKVASQDFIISNMTAEYEYGEAVKKMKKQMERMQPRDFEDPEKSQKLQHVKHIIELDKEQQNALEALCELESQTSPWYESADELCFE